MLLSLLNRLLARNPRKGTHPAEIQPSDLVNMLGEIEDLIRSGQHAHARSIINGLPQTTRDRPELQLCSLRLDFAAGDPATYRAALRALLDQHPELLPAWVELGTSALKSDDYLEAERSFTAVRRAMPGNARLLNNLGLALFRNQQLSEACSVFTQAVEIDASLLAARMNLAISLLCLGQFERGWAEYENRPSKDRPAYEKLSLPAWNGQSLGAKSLVVVAEQGLGDAIWAARFLPALLRVGVNVTLACQKSLVPLFSDCSLVDSVIAIEHAAAEIDRFGAKFRMMSLPHLLKITMDEVSTSTRYLHAAESRVKEWQHRLESTQRPRVGLVWRGNSTQSNDRNRSISLQKLEPIFAACTGTIVNIQVDVSDDEKRFLATRDNCLDASSLIRDFSDTAALLSQIDLLVSVDTSVTHLAGALGYRTLLLRPFVPDWRWQVGQNTSPWYASVEVLQQHPFGDWRSAISAAAERVRQCS